MAAAEPSPCSGGGHGTEQPPPHAAVAPQPTAHGPLPPALLSGRTHVRPPPPPLPLACLPPRPRTDLSAGSARLLWAALAPRPAPLATRPAPLAAPRPHTQPPPPPPPPRAHPRTRPRPRARRRRVTWRPQEPMGRERTAEGAWSSECGRAWRMGGACESGRGQGVRGA